VDGGEHDAPRRHRQQLTQVRAALGLHRRLAQQVLAPRERAEELVVEVVAVGEHNDGRVSHRRLTDDAPGVEGHRQALTRTLRVPDHADAAVARGAARRAARLVVAGLLTHTRRCAVQLGSPQRLAHCHLHGVELVVARHLLRHVPAAVVLKHDEVAHQVEKAPRRTDPFEHHLQLGHVRLSEPFAGDGAPGLEPFPPRGEGPHARFNAVGDQKQFVGGEEGGNLGLVCLGAGGRRLRWSRFRRRRS